MGFFSDLKEDLSQAVNELMPEENLDQAAAEGLKEQPVENTQEPLQEEIPEAQTAEDAKDNVAFEEMLKNLDSIEIPQENRRTAGRESSRRDAAGRRDWGKSRTGTGFRQCTSERYDSRKGSGAGKYREEQRSREENGCKSCIR